MASDSEADSLSARLHQAHSLGLSKKTISKEIGISIPSKLYYLPEIYELERRAIFSKHWFLVSHQARYKNIGDYVQYEMAGFNFVVVRNKQNKVVGFHNICR
jgi:phenylpropionate dioxygenase-like ring-hydroxylating dioxygenase large terminal subunit